jgi:hypothetical protein
MTASNQLKGLLAGLATVAVIGTTFAQGTPPNPAVANPAVGAGQQSSQGTPMGTTGTQGGSAAAATGSTAASTSGSMSATTGSDSSSSTMGASSDTTTTAGTRSRRVRADRN